MMLRISNESRVLSAEYYKTHAMDVCLKALDKCTKALDMCPKPLFVKWKYMQRHCYACSGHKVSDKQNVSS